MMAQILIVDDEEQFLESKSKSLQLRDFNVIAVNRGEGFQEGGGPIHGLYAHVLGAAELQGHTLGKDRSQTAHSLL